MVPATGRALALVLLTWAVPGAAQTPAVRRVAWPLTDFVVLGDSTYGVQVLASPNLKSRQGRARQADAALSLDPFVAQRWARGVRSIVDSVARMPPAERTPFETRALAANLGRTRILISFDGKGSRKQPFVFVVTDAVPAKSWWVEASDAELRQLLAALDTIAERSALDSAAPGKPRGFYLLCQLDEPPRTPDGLRLDHPDAGLRQGREARVLARFAIDSSGAVLPDSLQIVLSDGKDFTRAVERALLDAAYIPGRAGGRPVGTVLWQWFMFTVQGR